MMYLNFMTILYFLHVIFQLDCFDVEHCVAKNIVLFYLFNPTYDFIHCGQIVLFIDHSIKLILIFGIYASAMP